MTTPHCSVCSTRIVSIDEDGYARPCGHAVFPGNRTIPGGDPS